MLWRSEDSVSVKVPGVVLAMQRVPDYQPPKWPGISIVHLDLSAGAELDEPEARAVALGATVVEPQPDSRWRVLLDPAGHPFCITTIVPPQRPPLAWVIAAAARAGVRSAPRRCDRKAFESNRRGLTGFVFELGGQRSLSGTNGQVSTGSVIASH